MEGLIRLMNKEGITGPMNFGNPDERTIKEIAELVIRLTGSASEIVYKPLPKDDPVRRKPDISLAKKNLGWQPKVKLEEGLPRVIEYFRPLAERHTAPRKMPN
ncbi:MAG: dTDP-glucose 4,6-dehydratase [Planctomycetes bacterium ADurb.Bin412]|nr:MAG: dTDP-glucose 4,6-dehydratase [Planctomycetes bacterium ADurb.Bin412]